MKKFLSLALALVMCLSLVTISAGAKDFTDDSKITYGEAVDVVSAVGIVDGYTDGSFNPSATLTRGAAAKIITNMILGPTTAGKLTADAAPFKDVPADHVFAGQIAYCASQGIINGYADKSFRPSGTVTGYQFMKMLLGALGYDSKIEVYTGDNWSINVAKRAGSVGLIDGNDGFVGTAAMTREEACLYAYNALQANMVEYETKGTTIVVGGVEISQGASSAKEVVNSANSETVKNDNVMQFAERYFKDLTIKDGTDDFGRPATVCKYKNNKIGTYAKKADATYTAEVKLGTIYSDLGLTEKITASVTDNGDAAADVLVSKGNTAKLGANGVAVEVYYDSDAGTIDIAKITTYVGQVSSVKAATSTADRSIVIANKSKTAPAGFKNSFETEGFESDDIVLFTYANGEIQSVVKAESVDGELTGRTATKSATVGGTLYKYSDMMNTDVDGITMKSEVTLYLDSYGYAIWGEVSKAAASNYAYVLERKADSWDSGTIYAKLLLADGTVLSKVETKNDMTGSPAALPAGTSKGTIVTYSKNSDDVYTLYSIAAGTNYDADSLNGKTAKANFKLTKGTAAIDFDTTSASTYDVYANSKTVFVVASGDASDPTYTAYTGIANVPSISGTTGIAYYCKNSGMLTFAVIDATSGSVETDSKTVIFVDASTRSGESVNSDGDVYYNYKAVVNGEVTTIDVLKSLATTEFGSDAKTTDKLYTGVTYNSNNIVKAFSTDATKAFTATDVYKVTGDTIKLGTTFYYLASDVQVFFVDPDDGLQAYTTGSIEEHSGDKAYFIYKDGEISTLVIVSSKAATGPDTPTTTGELKDLSMGYDTTAKKFVVNATTTVALTVDDTYSVVIKNDAGVTVKSVSGLACTATSANASADFDVAYAAASGVGNYNVTLTVHDNDLNKDYTITGDVVVM